ncbi:hypothetical protein G6F31_021800 [Rhizopus arrhizus]|nr:hypothetical protein G6F31_021800 [Rhizopus arrhizus]
MRLHRGFLLVHLVQLHQQAGIAVGVSQQQRHPALCQFPWPGIFRRSALLHLLPHLPDQRDPIRVPLGAAGVHRQTGQFIR